MSNSQLCVLVLLYVLHDGLSEYGKGWMFFILLLFAMVFKLLNL